LLLLAGSGLMRMKMMKTKNEFLDLLFRFLALQMFSGPGIMKKVIYHDDIPVKVNASLFCNNSNLGFKI